MHGADRVGKGILLVRAHVFWERKMPSRFQSRDLTIGWPDANCSVRACTSPPTFAKPEVSDCALKSGVLIGQGAFIYVSVYVYIYIYPVIIVVFFAIGAVPIGPHEYPWASSISSLGMSIARGPATDEKPEAWRVLTEGELGSSLSEGAPRSLGRAGRPPVVSAGGGPRSFFRA